MGDWNLFDAICVVGRHCRLEAGMPHTAEDLLEEMDRHGIAEALVLDSLSRELHPADGNARVLEATRLSPRLHPAWAALPPGVAEDQPKPDDLVRRMRQHGVGALFLFTGQYRFNLSDWCLDELLGPLAEARVPAFIVPYEAGATWGGTDQTDWPGVVDLCRRWPTLPVVVSEWRIRRTQRLAYRALDACPNLRIELSGYWLYRGIEYITGRWGAGRLLFGSNWPTFNPGMTLCPLTLADISNEDKRRIAGGNLRELVAWCSPPAGSNTLPLVLEPSGGKQGRRPGEEVDEFGWVSLGPASLAPHPSAGGSAPAADEFVRFGRTGERPSGMRFCDCHGHLGGRFSHYHVPGGDLEATVREMERLGVEKACVFSFAGVTSDEAFGNDIVAEAVRRHPERFVGFTLLNPHRGRDAMRRELERCAKLGLRGIKLIPHYQGYPEHGPLVDVACQWAHDRKQIILNHSWGSPEQMERLATAYPDACFIAGHTTTAYADLMKRHANLFVCSCPLLGPRDCERTVAAIGSDRLLFGSDLQDLPIAWGLGPILFARLPAEEKRLVLGGNLRRLLRRYSLGAGEG